MPRYTFLDNDTDEIFEIDLKISEREIFLNANPNLKQLILDAPSIVAGVGSIDSKMDSGWKEQLQRIAEANPNSPLADRYGSPKTAKQVAVSKAVDKYRKRAGLG